MTVGLFIATSCILERGGVVRKLTVVEGLRSGTLVSTNKTETLTVEAMTAREAFFPIGSACEITGAGFVPFGDVLLNGWSGESGDHPQWEALTRRRCR